MLKKTVTYIDYNGTERTEDFYFNMNQVEAIELEYGAIPGKRLTDMLVEMSNTSDAVTIITLLKEFLLKTYGEKSPDGNQFVKNKDIRDAFEQSPAFPKIYLELATNAEYAAEFITGVIPSEVRAELGPDPKQAILDKMKDYQK